MKIYYLEFEDSFKFFNNNNDFTIEIFNEEVLEKFLKACKRRNCTLINLMKG